MPSGKSKECLVVLALLIAAATASAAPTISECSNSFIAGAVSPNSAADTFFAPETGQTTESCNSYLANIGAELLKPPADFTKSPPADARSLPAVPAAFFMVLTGFLCVSLVKDRRFWLAALAGLLWAGQAGIAALPQLATHLSSKKHIQRKLTVGTVSLHQLGNYGRLRSDIEGTEYIGLLHHLAGIPDAKSRYLHKDTYTFQPAIILARYGLNPLLTCLAAKAEQPVCFSPAFIFAQLPRGPPLPA